MARIALSQAHQEKPQGLLKQSGFSPSALWPLSHLVLPCCLQPPALSPKVPQHPLLPHCSASRPAASSDASWAEASHPRAPLQRSLQISICLHQPPSMIGHTCLQDPPPFSSNGRLSKTRAFHPFPVHQIMILSSVACHQLSFLCVADWPSCSHGDGEFEPGARLTAAGRKAAYLP